MASSSRSMQSVISNEDLLSEVLGRLPHLSLILFKSVSKHWFFLISSNVTFRRNPDPPSGLFFRKLSYELSIYKTYRYAFVPLDIRIPLLATSFTFAPVVGNTRLFQILHACNGLLLYGRHSGELYVYNPSVTNMFKVLPTPIHFGSNMRPYRKQFDTPFKMAFDPTKSPHYKVIYAELVPRDMNDDMGGFIEVVVQLKTFSSETGNWSLFEHQFPYNSFLDFEHGVYWNDAIYWTNGKDKIFKLDILNELPVLTALPTPLTLKEKVHYEYGLFESRGCLLLLGKDNDCSQLYTIYEKKNVYSEWLVKYTVNLDHIIDKRRSIRISKLCIVLGEREEDSFLVMYQDKRVLQ